MVRHHNGIGQIWNRTPKLSRRCKSVGRLERLEPRHLLASDVIISEVLARNNDTFKDDDGASSDYIELYNTGHTTADLTGWHLTDRLDDRTQWTFPETLLQPGEAIIVFASGQNRTDPNAALHTNFRVAGDGEYLALYKPDGRTVAYEFELLPQQYSDVSYGVGQTLTERTFVTNGNSAKVFLPDSAEADIATEAWTAVDFDDAAWTDRTTGLGFDDDALDGDFGPLIDAEGGLNDMRGNTASAYIRTEFQIDSEFLPTYENMQLDINFDDGFVGFLNGQKIVSVNAPDVLGWDSVATQSNGGIADSIHYTEFPENEFTVNGDASWVNGLLSVTPAEADKNGSIWRTDPVQFGSDYTFSAAMVFDVHSPGGTLPDGDGDGIGGQGMTFVLQSNDNNVLGTGGTNLGLENTGSTYLAIELDSFDEGIFDDEKVLPSHIGINTNTDGSLTRTAIPRFNGNSLFPGNPGPGTNFQYLWIDYVGETNQLDVYYSKSDTKPDEPTLSATIDLLQHFAGDPGLFAGWTGSTTAAFNGHDVVSFDIVTGIGEIGRESVSINLRDHIDKLQTGKNVLAFQGLNIDASDEDLLLVPSLTANEVAIDDIIGYFSAPTPGTLNGISTDPPAGGVTISKGSHIFTDAFMVEITAENENATIRYTTDGSLPIETSELYGGPIEVSETTRLRARAFEPERSPGRTSTSGFIQAGPQITDFENGKSFESNLPVIVIDSFGNRRVDSESVSLIPSVGVFIDPGEDGRANIFDEPEYAGRVGARIRGQSSQGWAKHQYALEFIEGDTDDSDRIKGFEARDVSVSIFGLPAESDWVLNGPYADKSQLNNYLTFLWSNKMGQYAPRTKLVEVFVNADGRNAEDAMLDMERDYRGTYVLMEKIKVDQNRVNITPLEPGDKTNNDITGGYIWKKDKTGAEDLNIRTGVRNQEVRIVEPGCSDAGRDPETRANTCVSGEISHPQIEWLTNHLTEFEKALYGENFRDPKEGYSNFIDVDSWVDTWLLVEFTKNIDGFRLSTYYYKDRGGKIKQGPAWDYNLALGNANYLQGGNPEGWYGTLLNNDQYPYWDRLFQDPTFEQAVVDRWHELRQTIFTTENLLADVDAAVNLLADGNPNLDQPAEGEPSNPISRNYARWTTRGYGLDKYHWPNCYFQGNMGDCPRQSPLPGGGQPNNYGDVIFIMRDFIERRALWIDEQFAPQIHASVDPGLVEKSTAVSFTAPDNHEIFYTTDGSDPELPLLIPEQFEVISEGAALDYMVPTGEELIDACKGSRLDDPAKCFMNPDYQLGANGETWVSGTQGFGYDDGNEFDAFINADAADAVKGNNSSVYIRIPFDVTEQMESDVVGLDLDVRYDDGFTAYLWQDKNAPTEVARANADGRPGRTRISALDFNEVAEATRDDADAVQFERFELDIDDNELRTGQNYLVIQALNDDASGDDFLFDARLTVRTIRAEPSPSLIEYTGPIVIEDNTPLFVRGRSNRNGEWTRAFQGDYIVNVADVKITELNYNPYDPTQAELDQLEVGESLVGGDFEFIELKNETDNDANLLAIAFTNGVNFQFGNVSLAAGDFGVIVKNQEAFEMRYGTDIQVLGEYGGNLDDNGETLTLVNAVGDTLADFSYRDNDPWSQSADGAGASLELANDATPNSLYNKYYNWQGSTNYGGTPGTANSQPVGIVINEILTRTDPLINSDAIEFLNTTDSAIDVSGWHLSDSNNNLQKYQIADGTIINPNETLVLTESDFNADPNDPNGFALNGTEGDDVWLTIPGENGETASIVDNVEFRASLEGESFSRFPNGTGRLAPTPPTLGNQNSYPRVGPVIISEIQYNPDGPSDAAIAADASITSSDLEFIEIHNPTDQVVNLTDWRIRGGVDLNFDLETQMTANETVVVISFNPANPLNASRTAAFRAQYGIDENVRLIGGYQGRLSGNAERVTLLSRDQSLINEPVVLPLVMEDEVVYDDSGLWPSVADGTGLSLHRIGTSLYGNLATSWNAKSASPGQATFEETVLGDLDADGIVGIHDVNLVCQEIHGGNPRAAFDLDGSGGVDLGDQTFLVENILHSSVGDANLDGAFDSRDLVLIFQAGEYDDNVDGNSTWDEGDWNCDQEFNSRDLVRAFIEGNYVLTAVADSSEAGFDSIGAALDVGVDDTLQRDAHRDELDATDTDQHAPIIELTLPTSDSRDSRFHDRVFGDRQNEHDLDAAIDDELLDVLI